MVPIVTARHSLPSIMPAGLRGSSALADYTEAQRAQAEAERQAFAQARFTGFGGSSVHEAAWPAPPTLLNPILMGLQAELGLAIDALVAFTAIHPGLDPNVLSRTPEGWALDWRRWALADLSEDVAESQAVFVIYRGDSFPYRLFLDRAGHHLLAVQPDAPDSPVRYRKLDQGLDLSESFGVFARLSQTPEG